MPDEIEIADYDASWPRLFEAEREMLARVLPPDQVLAIEHAGSTAIPGLSAKPIIDIFIAVRSIEVARTVVVEPIETVGYVYWAENPDRARMFFVKGMPPYGAKRTHHIHVLEPTNESWGRVRSFRDYLREHTEEARNYDKLKRGLAQRHRADREAYTRAKDDYILAVLKMAAEGRA